MKKITSVLLVLILIVGMFALTSCDAEPLELINKADEFLAEKPYNMTIKMNFTSDDAELNEVFEMMKMELPVTIDGDNFSMNMSMDIMGESINTKMSVVDKVLYYDLQLSDMSQKMKANLSDEQIAEFMSEQSAQMPVDYSQFAELKAEKKDGKAFIICTGITEEGKKELNDLMSSSLEEVGGMVDLSISDISYKITFNDEKYESMELSCTYNVSIAGKNASVSLAMSAVFDYDSAAAAVTAPADADSYATINYNDLLGA